jgi:hypothetical protein
MRTWIEAGSQPEYHRLCASMLALARAAIGRLAGRDGEASASPSARPRLSEAKFAERSDELRTAWLAAEQLVPGGGPIGRLGRLLRTSGSFVEPMLLALAAAPALDRSVALGYARIDREPLTAGLLLDLASATEANRIALYGALHPDAALRRSGVLLAGSPDGGAAACAGTCIAVAPSVLSVLRCEPVPLPGGVEELSPVPMAGAATRVLAALGVPPVRPGDLISITGGAAHDDAHVEALARLLAGTDGALVWRFRIDDRAEPDWAGLLRDAALGNALCLVAADTAGAWTRRLRWAVERSLRSALCSFVVAPAQGLGPAVDLAVVRKRADLDSVPALADEPITADLVARLR